MASYEAASVMFLSLLAGGERGGGGGDGGGGSAQRRRSLRLGASPSQAHAALSPPASAGNGATPFSPTPENGGGCGGGGGGGGPFNGFGWAWQIMGPKP
jgi:hypothetical protein